MQDLLEGKQFLDSMEISGQINTGCSRLLDELLEQVTEFDMSYVRNVANRSAATKQLHAS